MRRTQLALEHVVDSSPMQRCRKAQGDEAAGAELYLCCEAAIIETDLRIATEAEGAHGHGFHHGAVAPDDSAVLVEAGLPFLHNSDVGCRAANVRDDCIVEAGQVASTHEACRRTGEDGFDRA